MRDHITPETLQAKLKVADPEIQDYVKNLELENAKLHARIAPFEVQHMSDQNRISELKKQLKKTLASLEKAKSEAGKIVIGRSQD